MNTFNRKPVAHAVSVAVNANEVAAHVATTKAKKAAQAPEKLAHREALESVLSPAQVDTVEMMACTLMDNVLSRDTFTATMRLHVVELWAKFPDWDTYKTVRGVIHSDLGEYATQCFRQAVKAVFGKLPTAGTGKKGGKKGQSATRYVNGLMSDYRRMLDKIKAAPKRDLTPARMQSIGRLMTALALELKALKKDVA